MKVLYAETSAVLGWLLQERQPVRPAAVIDSAKKVVTSVLTVLEARRGILRAESERRITAAQGTRLQRLLTRASAGWDFIEITAGIRERAAESFPFEPVRTLDAIHLASAVEFSKIFPRMLVLSLDERIRANLSPLGLTDALRGDRL